MTDGHKRILRLAKVHGDMVKSVEEKLAQCERKMAALGLVRSELDRLAGSSASLAGLPMILRRLAITEIELKENRQQIAELQRQLIAYKSRQKALDGRARLLRDEHLRKAGEDDALETALLMFTKASGKQDALI